MSTGILPDKVILYFTFIVLLSSSFMRIRMFFTAVFLIQTFYAECMENIKRNLKNHRKTILFLVMLVFYAMLSRELSYAFLV